MRSVVTQTMRVNYFLNYTLKNTSQCAIIFCIRKLYSGVNIAQFHTTTHKMGSGISSVNEGQPIGYLFNSKPVYESDRMGIESGASSGKYQQISENTPVPEGWEFFAKIGEVKYIKPQTVTTRWWKNNKDQLISKLAAVGKLSAGVAAEVSLVVLPVLLEYGKGPAIALVKKKFPALAPIADVVVDAMIAMLPKGNLSAALYDSNPESLQVKATLQARSGAGEMSQYSYEGAAEHYGHGEFGAMLGGYDEAFAEGGCGCKGGFIGAAELDTTTIRDYTNSLNSKTKDRIIDDIVDVANKLGMKVTGSDRQSKVRSMLEQIPSGDKFKQNDEVHKKTCMAIAEAINRIHGNSIIDKTMPADVICQQVVEIISSLEAGMHTEFLAVYADVKKVLKNLHILRGALKDDHEAIVDRINASDDTLLPQQITSLTDLHDILLTEVDRQILMLQNLLNVTLFPTEKELSKLIRDKKDIHGYIEKIDVKIGSDRFGKVISDVLKGLGLTANFALLIERSLKTVGITLDEYAKGTSVGKLREKITSNLMGKNLDEAKLHEYLEAADLLYRNFYRNQDIAKKLDTTQAKSGSSEDMYSGGDDDRYQKTVMDKRIVDRKRVRNLIFTTFYKQLNDIFDRFVGSLDTLSMKIGEEIPLSDQLDGLRHVMQRINEELVRNKNIYYALIGFYNDAMSKSKKDTLIGELKMIASYIDTILEMPMYKSSGQYFMAVQSHIKSMIDLIEKFSDEIAAKFGRGEESAYEGAYDAEAIYGGADGESGLDVEPKLVFKPTKSIHDAIRQFDYKYKVAQIRLNMNRTSKELSHYSEKYEKIIANSIADILEKDKKVYDRIRKELSDEDKFNKSGYNGKLSGYVANGDGFRDEKEVREQRDAALTFLDAQWEAKKKFWATIEAADSYMRVFTDALVKNPNDIKEIKSMLDEIEVINDWYSDGTGNDLVSVFEFFPSMINEDGITTDNTATTGVMYPHSDYNEPSSSHYYQRIGDKIAKADTVDKLAAARPGNPHLVTLPTHGNAARNRVRKTFTGLAVLKNLLSVFIHVGSKFGGEELRKKIFMSPAQMYNNLIEYLQASAFSQGFGTGDLKGLGSDGDLPKSFRDTSLINAEFDLNTNKLTDRGIDAANAKKAGGVYVTKTTYGDDGLVRFGVNATAGSSTRFEVAAGASPATAVNAIHLFKKRWGVWMRSTNEELKQFEGFGFKMEDEYFVMMLKSIAAKIFTVTGMYDVLDRPMEFNGFNPIRMITGGNVETPKVEDGAVALYFRLPLLAQFYRNIFGFEGNDDSFESYNQIPRRNNSNLKISMVPDVDGTFAGLIRLIFRKTKYISNNAYSDEDIKEIIRECNLIYQRMQSKYPQNTVMETIHEFVAEINRRYGIVSKDERNEYEREFGYRYGYSDLTTPNQPRDRYMEAPETEYAILPGEGEEEVVRPSSAQRLLGEKFESSSDKKHMFTITTQHRDLVYKFRCAIDKYFENPDEEFTFNQAIKSTQMKLKKETRDEERFKIVSSLVRGVDVYSKVDGMKYVLFHETVVSGLNTLSAMHTLLSRFKKRAQIISLRDIQDQVWIYLRSGADNDTKTFAELKKHIKAYISDTLAISENDSQVDRLIESLFGYGEAQQRNGGHLTGVEEFALKGTNGVAVGIEGTPLRVRRWDNATPVIIRKGIDGPHASVKCKDTNDMVIVLGRGDLTVDVKANGNEHNGLITVLAGFGVKQLQKAYNDPEDKSDAKLAAETFMRFLFGREFVMKELLETLFGFGNDFQGLVEVKVDDGKLYLSYSGLKNLIEEMFQHVSYFLDLLRPHVNTEILAQYTDKLTPGSYYWLQEQLMEKIIIGRPSAQVALTGEGDKLRRGYASLDELMQKLTYTYYELTRNYITDGSKLSTSALQTPSGFVKVTPNKNSFDKVFAEMIFYDASKPQSGLIKSADEKGNSPDGGVHIVDFLHDPYEALHLTGPSGTKVLDTRYAARFYQLYSWKDELTFNRSALFAFNQLVAKYIKSFYDPVGSKIYSGVLNQFANGAFNRAVADQAHTYPDTIPGFHVKYGAGVDIKIPNAQIVQIDMLSNDSIADVQLLQQIVKSLLQYGVFPGQSATERAELLKLGNKYTKDSARLASGGAGANPSRLYTYLLIHAIGIAIEDIFKMLTPVVAHDDTPTGGLKANARLDDSVMALFALPNVKLNPVGKSAIATALGLNAGAEWPDTFSDARVLFGGTAGVNGVNPTQEQIMNVLLANGYDEIQAKVNSIIIHVNPAAGDQRSNNAGGINTGIFADIFGKYDGVSGNGANVASYGQERSVGNRVSRLFRRVISRPVAYPMTAGNMASMLALAQRMYPFADDAIGASSDFEYRTQLFAALITRLAYEGEQTWNDAWVDDNNANANGTIARVKFYTKAFERTTTTVYSAISSARSTYSPSPDNEPKLLVKYDDALMLSTDRFLDDGISHPAYDTGYLVAANGDMMKRLGSNIGRNNDPDNDNINKLKNFNNRMDPDADHILFTSLSVVLKNMITSRSVQNQTLVYIQDNVADIPLYMKEKMRANLPAFKNLFKELSTRCEMLKKFMGRPELDLTRKWTANHGKVPKFNPWPYVLQPTVDSAKTEMSSANTKNRWTGILDSIIRGCTSLITSCDQVLREVGDDPKYFELYQNSIKEYKTQYGMDPLMPLSSTLAIVKNVTNETYMDFFPIHSLGEDQFKFMYATRSLLQQPQTAPLMENVPGFAQIVESFNLIIDSKLQADKGRADAFLKTFVKLARYIYEAKHIKGLITPYVLLDDATRHSPNDLDLNKSISTHAHIDGMFTRDDMVLTNKVRGDLTDRKDHSTQVNKSIHGVLNGAAYVHDGPVILTNKSDVSLVIDGMNKQRANYKPYPKPVYAIAKSLTETVKMTESSFKEDKIKELVEYMINTHGKRNSLEIQNIIDLNIVPINVHALMREIPLANLYNYAYTFDRLIIELYYGLKNDNARQLISDLCGFDAPGNSGLKRITSSKDMLVALLLKPYMNVFSQPSEDPEDKIEPGANYYEKYVKSMLVGVPNNGELGRPKFLSDQIYNKAIFGEVYQDQSEYNEMGPSAAAVSRTQIDKETAAQMLGGIINAALEAYNTNATKYDGILRGGAAGTRQVRKQFTTAVGRYLIENPNITFIDLEKRVYTRYFADGSGFTDLLAMRHGPSVAGGKLLSAVTALTGILCIGHFMAMVSKINRDGKGFVNTNIGKYLGDMIQSLNTLTAFHRVNGAEWGGLGHVHNQGARRGLAINDSPADIEIAQWIITDSLYENDLVYPATADLSAAPHDLGVATDPFNFAPFASMADYKMDEPAYGILKKAARNITMDLKDFKMPATLVAATVVQLPLAADLLAAVRDVQRNLNTNPQRLFSEKPVTPTALHWLDMIPERVEAEGEDPFETRNKHHNNALDSKQVRSVDVTPLRSILAAVGRLRFDTVFIRNLIFITNLYRSVRMKMQRDLVYNKDVILRSAPITRPQLTEFYGNQVDHARENYLAKMGKVYANPMNRRYDY